MPSKTKPTASAVAEKPVVATATSQQIGVSNSNLDRVQIVKAFQALAAHVGRRSSTTRSSALPLDGPSGNLRDPCNVVYLQLTLNTLNPRSHVKPMRINLPHALHTPGEISVCLLTKDPQREYKDLLMQEKIRSISRVVGVAKLKGKFKPFDARRRLVEDHDVFLADDRIVPTLPNLCGKVFFDAKKNPITVEITKKGEALRKELDSAISGTTFVKNKGSCSSIKVGYLNKHSAQELTENVIALLPAVLGKVKGGWENVHNLDVKTGNSAALPIWNAKLGVKTHVTPSKALTTEASELVAVPKNGAPKSSKKRSAVEEEMTEETSSKKKMATCKKSAVVQEQEQGVATPSKKDPSPRKTRAKAAAAAATANEAARSTPVKAASATPRKTASSVSRRASKVK
ncbi:related to UTP30-subunit of U3-containing 90S pre-ribosome [Ustilago bromivora]|uniref:Ribosomal L1 domain-containing protein 1 n=1 Tax=Ustilago bromivora TaxID=307758 RepID=A0A1K0G0Z2_9BASI|nr:related to UTP30-subunit of U3-containing 90S pre-ribosome [Ustilago bromivora]SYW77855.1 related to UTP30 - subunit of U3-containing 90S pre-ribosome [Ustilago bromivora]